MSSFTTSLLVMHLDGRRWKVMKEFVYHVGDKQSTEVIKVPRGFITDFASIPRLFWTVIGHPTGRYGKAAVVHDFTYAKALYKRKRCDEIFAEAMRVLRIGWLKRIVMYQAVRRFGWIGWNMHRRKEKEEVESERQR